MTEENFQKNAAAFLRNALPKDLPWTAVESSNRGARDGARQKRKGVRAGWMDFQLLLPPFATYLGLECKAKDGSPSASQKEMGAFIAQAGGFWFPVKTLGDIEHILRAFQLPLSSRSMETPRPHLVKLVNAANIRSISDLVGSYYSTQDTDSGANFKWPDGAFETPAKPNHNSKQES